MSDATTLRELIARVDAASGPDRELDYRIAYVIGWRFNGFEWNEQSRDQRELSDKEFETLHVMAGLWKRPDQNKWPYPGDNYNDPPAYTASLDAAVSLVMDGHNWALDCHHETRAEARTFYGTFAAGIIDGSAEAATPALALCAAALRARLIMMETGHE